MDTLVVKIGRINQFIVHSSKTYTCPLSIARYIFDLKRRVAV